MNHETGGYEPTPKEMIILEDSVTDEQREMTNHNKDSEGTCKMGHQKEINEILEVAEQKGERILEIPITISYTVKIPESTVVSSYPEPDQLSNAIFYQTHDITLQVKDKILDEIKKQGPEVIEDGKQKQESIRELDKMILYDADNLSRKTEKSPSYNPDRARKLVATIKEINEKYKYTNYDREIDYALRGFAKFGDKID